MIAINAIRSGQVISYNGGPHLIVSVQHRTPGNLRAFVQVKMRHLLQGNSVEHRFSSTELVEVLESTKRILEFSYGDGDAYVFIDPVTFDQVELPEPIVRSTKAYLTSGASVTVMYLQGAPVAVELPPTVVLAVTVSPNAVRGDTSRQAQKIVTTETELMVTVPLFINVGDRIRVRTEDNTYLGRD
jgi:elongation factor P